MGANDDIADDEFPNDEFFPDINRLLGNMTNGASTSTSVAPYVMLSSLLGLRFGLLLVAIDMDMMLLAYDLDCLPSFNNMLLVSIIITIILFTFIHYFSGLNLMENSSIIQQQL